MMALLATCSSSDPQIMQVDHYLVASWTPSRDEVSEALVVSVDLFDPDGAGELEELHVRLAAFELGWTLGVEELAYHEQDGQRWYTTPPLEITGRARFPRGEVEITARDLSGREDRRTVSLPQTLPEFSADDAPRMEAGRTFLIDDEGGPVVIVVETVDGRREVREISEPPESVAMWRVFERPVLQRLQETVEPFHVWVLQEWSPRIYLESGPWAIDPAQLTLPENS
jgi:hypothetical protein